MPGPWIPKDFNEACKRAAGRRRYHAKRRRFRDERQLAVAKVLLVLNWESFGYGRPLAELLSVDPATISRDIRDLRKWRRSFIEKHEDPANCGPGVRIMFGTPGRKTAEQFADAVIARLIAANIHPRLRHFWSIKINDGFASLTVGR